ncbi:MAG: DUF4402 domain-containing protein [Rhodothermales bacterium]
MKQTALYRLSLFAACLLLLGHVLDARAQASDNTTLDVDIDLVSPPPSCGFTIQANLNYGTAEKPTSGSGSVTISATTGSRSSSNTTVSGSSNVGQVRLSGSNVSSYTVTRTFPSTLTRSGGGSLSYSGAWAQSASSSSGYSTISGSSYNGSAGGSGSSFNRYFRFGGTTSGIGTSDPDGNYDNTISASATCN